MKETRRRLLARALTLLLEVTLPARTRAGPVTDAAPVQSGVVHVLSRLVASDAVRPRDLLPAVHLPSGGLSNLLGRLEAAGLITRTADRGHDGRAVSLSITPKGRELEQRVARACADGVRESAAAVKELIVILVEAGATPRPVALPNACARETRATLGLVELHLTVEAAIATSDGNGDVNAAVALATLDHLGPCRPRLLADVLHLTSGGASRLIDRLEQAGHVERSRDAVAHDHRGVVVAITPSGVDHLSGLLEPMAARLDDVLGLVRAIWVEVHDTDPTDR